MKFLLTPVIIVVFLFSFFAMADPKGEFALKPEQSASKPKKKTVVKYRRSESHKFGGLSLKGRLKKPELGYIYKRKGLRQEQIVNIPEHFDREIIQGSSQF